MAYPWEFDEEIEQRLADNNPISGGRSVSRSGICGVGVRSEGASGLRRLFAVIFGRPTAARLSRCVSPYCNEVGRGRFPCVAACDVQGHSCRSRSRAIRHT